MVQALGLQETDWREVWFWDPELGPEDRCARLVLTSGGHLINYSQTCSPLPVLCSKGLQKSLCSYSQCPTSSFAFPPLLQPSLLQHSRPQTQGQRLYWSFRAVDSVPLPW